MKIADSFSVCYCLSFQELYIYDSAGKEMFADIVQQHVSATYRATASNGLTKASSFFVLFLLFMVLINTLNT